MDNQLFFVNSTTSSMVSEHSATNLALSIHVGLYYARSQHGSICKSGARVLISW